MILTKLFPGKAYSSEAHRLYTEIVEQARSPVFYRERGVPDTLDGRFELIVLHVFLVLHRLKEEDGVDTLSQDVFDVMFADLDQSLREMGVGDLSVGKKVKVMAQSFYGHVAAYDQAINDETAMDDALRRNLYGTVTPSDDDVAFMRTYVLNQRQHMSEMAVAAFLAGNANFKTVS